MEFKYEPNRIYAEDADQKVIAEVTFPVKDGIATVNHTYVDESLRGQGVAGQLVKAAADQILASGFRIAATCPYAVSWFAKHPEYQLTASDEAQTCTLKK
jgi:predicted GNAT family acetyltransferase